MLGLTPLPDRLALPYAGEWYALNEHQQLHLIQLPNPDAASMRPDHGGRDRHIALAVTQLAPLKARLGAAGVAFTPNQ